MRQGTYLNVILTVNAVLLSAVLWTHMAGTSLFTTQAQAQSPGAPNPGVGIPNSADQRNRMIESLRDIQGSMDSMRKFLESGKVKVEVTNLDKIKFTAPAPDKKNP
jgi:hypothetical protein